MKKSAIQLTTVLLTLVLLMAVLILYGVKKDTSEPAAPALEVSNAATNAAAFTVERAFRL